MRSFADTCDRSKQMYPPQLAPDDLRPMPPAE